MSEMLGGGGPIGRSRADALPAIELEVGAATRAWVVRLVALAAAAVTVAALGVDPAGWVIGGLAAALLVALPRTFAPGAFVLGVALLVLRGEQPGPFALAVGVLTAHLALAASVLVEASPLRTLVPLALLRSRLPGFALAQGAGQAAAALAWAVQDSTAVLPWLAVAALAGLTGLGWWLLRTADPAPERG